MRLLRILLFQLLFCSSLLAQETTIRYLSGTDKDHTVAWDFFCTDGAKSGYWTKLPVPSNWEMQGFGGYNYGHEKIKHQEKGLYRYHFKAGENWEGKQIELVFAGVMTDADVRINGKPAGPIHQGGFYQFSYNISPLIRSGADNLLEVTVSKMSADSSVNRAERLGDFWVFGGIYRPVYLKISPLTCIDRVAIDAKADGSFRMNLFGNHLQKGDKFSAQVFSLKGVKLGTMFSTVITDPAAPVQMQTSFSHPLLWNAETPNLYTVSVSIQRAKQILHRYHQRFGFRTIEVRKGDGIYINNTKIRMKGVNRHSFWPETGRTLSRAVHLLDIRLIKDMNMNAVRMSHYPPDTEFLDLCDSLGLYVLDELTGWQKNYATPVGKKLVKELVIRDVNHPSILFWDNGNEGGFNTDLDNDFSLYDPQNRTVLHPWALFNGIDTKHYPEYSYVEKAGEGKNILLHTEMLHGLYDGGLGAGLEDYWNLMQKNPRHAGGFLWVLADEGIIRKDKHDSIDTYGNNAPDGIVGPHREKEGSYFAIKEIWSPVFVETPALSAKFTGRLAIENRYDFTNLSSCSFQWQLVRFPLAGEKKTGHTILSSGNATLALPPHEKGIIQLKLPANWMHADALRFIARDPNGHELYSWQWAIVQPIDVMRKNVSLQKKENAIRKVSEKGDRLVVEEDGTQYSFDTRKGILSNITRLNKRLPFGNGPLLAGDTQTLQSFRHYTDQENNLILESVFTGKAQFTTQWVFRKGLPLELKFSYTESIPAPMYGISFQMDTTVLTGIKWMGKGPYRVWKNRLKGTNLDVWHKPYNQTITGETFDYPEFSGYHANFYWARLENSSIPFTIYTDTPGIYLQLLHPPLQKSRFNPYINPPFPTGDLGFFTAIPPIGTKFKGAETLGPQSQYNRPVSGISGGHLWFDFR